MVGVSIMELPITSRRNCYVVVFQNLLKWPMVYLDQKEIWIAQLLVEEVIPTFGVLEALRGTNLL